jgi:hypothetical protein
MSSCYLISILEVVMSIVDDKLEAALKKRIKEQWSDQFQADKWKGTAFKSYTDNPDIAKIVVLEPTVAVAQSFELELSKQQKVNLQNLVSLDTVPEKILPEMSNAVAGGSPIEPG